MNVENPPLQGKFRKRRRQGGWLTGEKHALKAPELFRTLLLRVVIKRTEDLLGVYNAPDCFSTDWISAMNCGDWA